jgi:hypothetical protein
MPTKLPRHTITETGPVAEAFARVRAVGEEPDVRRLVVLGAQKLIEEHHLRETDGQRRAALQERLIARTTRPGGVDTDAAIWAHEQSWTRHLDE